ncbi:hypothetical protein PTSG_00562 [Salpingoeca rosetta]|uniref:Las1-like protein n=1 Tax=Salpingoeca rosetta (strain ATCC 50818 / BSB-021) TaxID=946362 RepID=F2TWU3_SALR5|nr:uncharacterized protein PTSG_00562 [Salpingoeca rosetta]EGD72539.1 hypothetical protein PTSG_00562 [Salpingoeca rosetta]|eukprot:XP_004999108.1 hypothetical protein PTSG_00562 [Salpingoeca rosetta]
MEVKVVPWRFKQEWVQVKAQLNSGDHGAVALARDRMRCWATRGKLPLAIEATMNLVSALLFRDTSPDRQLLIQMLSLAIVRFVNGFSDEQQKTMLAKPLSLIAADLKIPTHVVDTRHNATHQALPGLPMLEMCTFEAMQWLRTFYWQEQEDANAAQQQQTTARIGQYVTQAEDNRAALRVRSAFAQRQAAQREAQLNAAATALVDDVPRMDLLENLAHTWLWTTSTATRDVPSRQQASAAAASTSSTTISPPSGSVAAEAQACFTHSRTIWEPVLTCMCKRYRQRSLLGTLLIAQILLQTENLNADTCAKTAALHDLWLEHILSSYCKGVSAEVLGYWFAHVSHLPSQRRLIAFQTALLQRLAAKGSEKEQHVFAAARRALIEHSYSDNSDGRSGTNDVGGSAAAGDNAAGGHDDGAAGKVDDDSGDGDDSGGSCSCDDREPVRKRPKRQEGDAGGGKQDASAEKNKDDASSRHAWTLCRPASWSRVPIGLLPGFVSPILTCTIADAHGDDDSDGRDTTGSRTLGFVPYSPVTAPVSVAIPSL